VTEASLAAQKSLRNHLVADTDLIALVPAADIRDSNARPERFPCIILGEATVVGADAPCMSISELHLTAHVWTREPGTENCKLIAGAVRRAAEGIDEMVDGFDLGFAFDGTRYLRDPDGETAHGVVTFAALAVDLEEAA